MTASQTCVSVRHNRLPALPKVDEVVLKTQHVVAKTPEARTVLGDLEAGALQVGVLPVPDDDFGNSRLPQALRDGLHQLRVRGVAAATQAIHLQPHHLARAHDLLPCFEGRVAVEGSLQGAVEQLGEPRGVETRPGAADFRVASNDHARAPRFGGRRAKPRRGRHPA